MDILNTLKNLESDKKIQCLVDLELADGSTVRVQVYDSTKVGGIDFAFGDSDMSYYHDFSLNDHALNLATGETYELTEQDEEAVAGVLWEKLHGGDYQGMIRGSLV